MHGTDANRPEWHGDEWPELRQAPPWVMAEMVAAVPDLVAPIVADPAAPEIARLVAAAAGAGQPVVVTGCGTSEHGAMAVAALLDAGLRRRGLPGGRPEARQALEAALDPRVGGLCLTISHDGGTRATLLAAEAARATGARVALVTARPDGPIAAIADAVFVTPMQDRSWCHTVAYASAILAGATIGADLAGEAITAAPLAGWLTAILADWDAASDVAGRLSEKRPLLICGAGADEITARELALKIEEGPRLPAVGRHLETLLHGHLVACDATTGLLLLALDDRGRRRDTRLVLAARAASAVGMAPAAILSAQTAANLPADVFPGGRIVLPPTPPTPLAPLAPLLSGAAALQTLTLALVDRAGVNPDLIRREEAPWREAAAVAEGAADW